VGRLTEQHRRKQDRKRRSCDARGLEPIQTDGTEEDRADPEARDMGMPLGAGHVASLIDAG
jgi:hypothetical protein